MFIHESPEVYDEELKRGDLTNELSVADFSSRQLELMAAMKHDVLRLMLEEGLPQILELPTDWPKKSTEPMRFVGGLTYIPTVGWRFYGISR